MAISKKQLQDAREVSYALGQESGRCLGRMEQTDIFNNSKAAAQRDILKAAAELGQANAKLTYAMSRMISEKGW